MIFIAMFLAAVLVILRATAPKRHAVHASRAQPLPHGIKPGDIYVGGDFLLDETGTRIDTRGKFVGRAVRDSMSLFGIPNGATFVADYLDEGKASALVSGDVVVIDGPAAQSETGLRLRVVERVGPDRTVVFRPDGYGQSRRDRSLSEVIAKVTHVSDPSTSGPSGVAWRFLSRLLGPKVAA